MAKNSFSIYGVNAKEKPGLQRTLARSGVIRFFANFPACLVGMEACASSEYWAGTIESLGHTVRRIHSRYVKAYLLGAKNDANEWLARWYGFGIHERGYRSKIRRDMQSRFCYV